MTDTTKTYDTLHMGRSSIDLYSNDIGVPFADITSFAAYVGGSPTNISVGAGRLVVCSINLPALQEHPEARQLLASIQRYMTSRAFQPPHTLAMQRLEAIV